MLSSFFIYNSLFYDLYYSVVSLNSSENNWMRVHSMVFYGWFEHYEYWTLNSLPIHPIPTGQIRYTPPTVDLLILDHLSHNSHQTVCLQTCGRHQLMPRKFQRLRRRFTFWEGGRSFSTIKGRINRLNWVTY